MGTFELVKFIAVRHAYQVDFSIFCAILTYGTGDFHDLIDCSIQGFRSVISTSKIQVSAS